MDIYLIVFYIFCLSIMIMCLNYILRSIVFIKPYTEKYKIMAEDLENNIKGRYNLILFCFLIIFFLLYLSFNNFIFLLINITTLLICTIFLYIRYSKYTMLDFINEFNYDLFNWHKIYTSSLIDEETKRKCFLIHCLDYDAFYEQHQRYLEVQRMLRRIDLEIIESQIDDKKEE